MQNNFLLIKVYNLLYQFIHKEKIRKVYSHLTLWCPIFILIFPCETPKSKTPG